MISTKSDEEIRLMEYAGNVCFELLNLMEDFIKEGTTTKEINDYADKFIRSHDCIPSELGFEGYPASICTSVNDEVVHGIPGNRSLKNGDIISLDVVACYKGYHADTARTYKVGNVSKDIENLMAHTKEALYKGLSVIKEGAKLNDICETIESVANTYGYGVIRELTGHGIGKEMHEDPYIPNYSNEESKNITLKSGMTLAIEPMFSLKGRKVWLLEDDWTISTQDGSPAAHYEHTIVVTKEGYKILTGEWING